MTQEEKDLLLRDLCARLPYGVKLRYVEDLVMKKESHTITLNNIYLEHIINGDADIKPYLRPMSSMTEEEKEECCSIFNNSMYQFEVDKYGDVESTEPTVEKECLYYDAELMAEWLTWLNAHHFDYRGLIERGLALEAPEGMYKI